MSSTLHTINDEGAQRYIEQHLKPPNTQTYSNENDEDYEDDNETTRLLSKNRPNRTYNVTSAPYYIQHSLDDIHKSVYGQEPQGKCHMSPVRRMFCLLVLFDCLLTFLMWIIYLQISGCLKDNIKQDVMKYTIRTSFFDVVVVSFARCTLLLLVYSFTYRCSKWYIIAFTTSSNTVFMMVKVFETSFEKGQPLNYLIIIFSFVICWCEAWHFDFQVVPNEMSINERILSTSIPAIASSNHQRPKSVFGRGSTRGTTDQRSAFFTPYAGSVYRARSPSVESDSSSLSNFSAELNEVEETDHQLIRESKDIVHMVFRMLYINEGWTVEREERDNIAVSSRIFDGVGKVFKLESVMEVPSKVLDRLFWEDVDSHPSWNASLSECQIVRRINNKTDIVYSVSAEAGGGVIASRDFVSLRRRKRKGPLTLLCAASVETDLIPTRKSIIRGRNGPGGWILRDIIGEPTKTEFIWLLNTELKGWLPQRLVEQTIASVMVDTARDIRKHATTLPQT